MYHVKIKHFGPIVRKGDQESDWELLDVKTFILKKDAKAWILHNAPSNAIKRWKTGNEPSQVYWETDKTWFNEGTGNTDREMYNYILEKI